MGFATTPHAVIRWRNASLDMGKLPQCGSDVFGGRNPANRNGTRCCGYAGAPRIRDARSWPEPL
ncbi:hypothetical protein D9T17_12625 [Lysobacter enzymogenes]|uniref:Uncharacterized protein n=1 Tax=Lysobacter enzymogenes TaxID=69 RepID=A0A3N2RGU1_LYSEN|nr:hypothetical protein D9T17_12625 [Lysobacter enzymogenes]